MISREGELRTFQRPGSRFSLRAAKSNRALWASQGLISCSSVMVAISNFLQFRTYEAPVLPQLCASLLGSCPALCIGPDGLLYRVLDAAYVTPVRQWAAG